MHNCKTTRDRLTELLLDGVDPRAVLGRDLRECAECRAELTELSETLRVTTRLIEAATPPNSYWPGYHARLKERLRAAQQPRVVPGQYDHADSRSLLTRFFFSSIRVPVPAGLALLLIMGLAFMFSTRVPAEPVVVQVPIEVPVVQERTIERIVYRDREKPTRRARRTPAPPANDSALAALQGFKPTDEVKLTVIKGGAANEK